MPDITTETIDKLVQIGRAFANNNLSEDGDELLVLPANMKVEDVSRFMPPKRIQANAVFHDAPSFSAYVNRFKTENTILTWHDEELDNGKTPTFTAHMDYHEPAPSLKPDWRRHTARFVPQITPEFAAWLDKDGENMTQMDFALWLEENYALLTEPNGAELLELVKSLEGRQDVRFNSAVRLQTGTHRLHYDEDVTLRGQATPTSKAGELDLPTTIQAKIIPYYGMLAATINARLRFSIEGRKLTLRFETIAKERLLRDAFDSQSNAVQAAIGLPVWNGKV